MPTGRTEPERQRAVDSHGHLDDDCKLSCYYQFIIIILSTSLQKVAGATKSDSGKPQNAPKYAFETPEFKKKST